VWRSQSSWRPTWVSRTSTQARTQAVTAFLRFVHAVIAPLSTLAYTLVLASELKVTGRIGERASQR
jgi:hypothetical protein